MISNEGPSVYVMPAFRDLVSRIHQIMPQALNQTVSSPSPAHKPGVKAPGR
jgi:hypothetical protein